MLSGIVEPGIVEPGPDVVSVVTIVLVIGLPLCGLFGPVDSKPLGLAELGELGPVDSDPLGPLGPVDPGTFEAGDSGLVITVVNVLTNVLSPPGTVEAGMVLPGIV